MNNSIIDKIRSERSIVFIILAIIIIVLVVAVYLIFSFTGKKIEITSPLAREEWEIGQTYSITWESKGVDKVGIVLYKGSEAQWIAENIDAESGKYDWHIYSGQGYGDGFWLAVFEYPWQEGNLIDYTNGAIVITYPEMSSCDSISVEEEWPYLASDFPDLRGVFLTEESYEGNLNGLDGADKICQQEAEDLGLEGEWMAFLGGENDNETAVERLKKSSRGTEGIFVQAVASAVLLRGSTCHRLIAGNFQEFLDKLSDLKIVNEDKLDQVFLERMEDIWLGRIDETGKKNCTSITFKFADANRVLAETYSFTTTCQNWTQEESFVQGYPVPKGQPKPSFPTCYTPSGALTDAVALAGLALGLEENGGNEVFSIYQGKQCNEARRLICIEK